MKSAIFACITVLSLSPFASGQLPEPVPACAYCGVIITSSTSNSDHASNCPYYRADEGGGYAGDSGYTGTDTYTGDSPLGLLVIRLFEQLFAPAPGVQVSDVESKDQIGKRRQAEFTQSVAKALDLLGNRPGVAAPSLGHGMDVPDELVFGGISFFDPGPMVVDLRHVRRASYFAKAVETASPEDVQLLLNEAIKVANGAPSSLGNTPPNAALPEIDDKGLLAFQQVNMDYDKAYDTLLKCHDRFKAAQHRRELAHRTADTLRAEVERNMAGKTDPDSRKKKRAMLDEIDAELQKEEEAWMRANSQLTAAQDRAHRAKEESVRVLRALALNKEPADFHPPIASLPALKEEDWLAMQTRMQEEHKTLDERSNRLQKDLGSVVPPLKGPERVHEGVILGFGTDAKDAEAMETDGVSCFTGKTYADMNKASEKARQEGRDVGGAMVVSFGNPKQKNEFDALSTEKKEAARVLLDHMSQGDHSLTTPQGQQAVRRLAGKEFDRLIAHSNGASITEALIRHDVIKVDELNIVGGDKSLLNGHAYQQLLDSGKVKRVVVWINVNDPVPGLTSIDQLNLAERSVDAATHLAKKISGDPASGNAGVEYRFMWGADYQNPAGGDVKAFLSAHFIESSYYPGMANEMGVSYVPPKRILKKK
ncbi:MAG: hypothetical protein K9N55_20420 [Phycisphaerae bacterium]|nr:hypothetical protein [Phycisphaerae bacterium]